MLGHLWFSSVTASCACVRQVVGFDGSTTIGEFVQTLNQEIGCRDVSQSGLALYSDDPFQPDQRHLLQPEAKVGAAPADAQPRRRAALRGHCFDM